MAVSGKTKTAIDERTYNSILMILPDLSTWYGDFRQQFDAKHSDGHRFYQQYG